MAPMDADDALEQALAGTPSPVSDPAPDPATTEDADPVEGRIVDDEGRIVDDEGGHPGTHLVLLSGGADIVPEGEWLCTPEEAQTLVDRTRQALTDLDDSLRAIVVKRAWQPLGYPSPKEFVLAELGPGAEGGKSRAQAYRIARMAMFFYGLAEAFGDDSPLLDISERSLRALPAGANGENDAVLTERVAERLAAVPDITQEQAQDIWNEEYERARAEVRDTGRLAREGENAGWDDPDFASDGDDYTADDFDLSAITPTGEDTPAEGEAEGEDPDWEQNTTSRLDYIETRGPEGVTDPATTQYREALDTLSTALAAVAAAEEHLPAIVEYATDEEITSLTRLAVTTQDMTKALIDESTARDESFTF